MGSILNQIESIDGAIISNVLDLNVLDLNVSETERQKNRRTKLGTLGRDEEAEGAAEADLEMIRDKLYKVALKNNKEVKAYMTNLTNYVRMSGEDLVKNAADFARSTNICSLR